MEVFMKKALFLLTLMVLVGSVVWAGGTKEGETKELVKTEFEKSWENYKDEPITLTLYSDDKNMEEKEFMRYTQLIPQLMRDTTGVTLDIRKAVDASEQSINLLIAGGEYPDLMLINTKRQPAVSLVENERIWAFDDLKDKYGIDPIKNININQRFAIRSRFMRDKLYYLTTYGLHPDHLESPWLVKWMTGVSVNGKQYKDIGSPPIKSFDDLMDVAQKIKAKFPRVEFPLMITRSTGRGPFNEPGEIGKMLLYYGLNDPTTYWKLGQPRKFYFQTEAFLDLIKDFNKMLQLELVSPIIWTGSKQDKLALVYNGNAAFEVNSDGDNVQSRNKVVKKKFPDEYYVMLPAFSAHPKYKFGAADTIGLGGALGWCIPKGGDNTLRSLVFVDYMMSQDFQILNQYGREGVEHDIVKGMPVLKPELIKMGPTSEASEQKYDFNVLGGAFRDAFWKLVDRQFTMPELLDSLKTLKPVADKFHDLTFVPEAADAPYPEGSEELKIYSVIRETFGDELTTIIQGPPEKVESDYKALLAKVEGMGLQKLNDFQEKYAQSYADLIKKYRY
jgi:putative aldouronate transport system substrate-binding protein